ncbi:hypothetical protein REC12_02860 [Desulfosporosinus sp. PR]|uniref:hypothetical protein n=1 Tax=Candidatus Desulfosporosinus nitrosoreducens TaxID=3401928 RepID=UPI0027F20E98|nr:hypothetical protein [Desulfosporosinus sp. PR]MDQ7092526.1 hypothetical protein [Desulfosporosinus sp. PR]
MSSPETVVQDFSRARIHEEAVNVERVYFYKTDKRVNPKQEEPFLVLQGKLPLLLSAPHAVRHYRQKKIIVSDQFTGSIVFLLNQLVGAQGIAVTKLYGGDPNFDYPCLYKERLADLCRKEKVKFILDIHGAPREREFDADLGTCGGKTLLGQTRVLETLAHQFQSFGFKKISHDRSLPPGSNTITGYAARELGIPAVQIEINKQYRVPAQNPQGFQRLMGALRESIKSLTQ